MKINLSFSTNTLSCTSEQKLSNGETLGESVLRSSHFCSSPQAKFKTEYAALGFSFFVASCIRTGSYQKYIPIPVQLLRPGSANRKLIRYRRQYRDVQRPVLRWNRLRFRKSDRNDPL